MMKWIKKFIDFIAPIRGVFALVGLLLVALSFVAHLAEPFFPPFAFLTYADWTLHVGILVGLAGLLFADAL